MTVNRQIPFIFTVLVLTMGIGFLAWSGSGVPTAVSFLPGDALPAPYNGWVQEDLPIANTESMQAAIDEQLDFDDHIYRKYTKAGLEFSVYVAVWSPKRKSPLEISTHAPDNCWVSAGWKLESKSDDIPSGIFNIINKPVNSRQFSINGNSVNVFYWQRVGTYYVDFVNYGTGKTFGFIKDNIHLLVPSSADQVFVRVSSPHSWEKLDGDTYFVDVVKSLQKL